MSPARSVRLLLLLLLLAAALPLHPAAAIREVSSRIQIAAPNVAGFVGKNGV